MEWLSQAGSNKESQGSRTTLSTTRQEVPKSIQKPYTLVTFDEMHQKDLCGGCQVFSGQAERIRLSPRSSMKKYFVSICVHFLICVSKYFQTQI